MKLSSRLLTTVCAGPIIAILLVWPTFAIADARGFYYTEILPMSLVVIITIVIAGLASLAACLVAAGIQYAILTALGQAYLARLACGLVIAVVATVSVYGLIASALDRHFALFLILIPTVVASLIALSDRPAKPWQKAGR